MKKVYQAWINLRVQGKVANDGSYSQRIRTNHETSNKDHKVLKGSGSGKAGIISLTKSFARYFGENIRVNAVAPGLIDTPLTASTGEDPKATTDYSIIHRMGTAEEIANAINFLLSDEASYITGQILAVDGGFTLK